MAPHPHQHLVLSVVCLLAIGSGISLFLFAFSIRCDVKQRFECLLLSVYNLYIFFGEVSINIFCLTLSQVICFLIVGLFFN